MIRNIVRITLFFLCMGLFSQSVFALDTTYSGNYLIPEHQTGFAQEEYEVTIAKKFQRGAENFLLGWLEVPQGVKSEIYFRRGEYLPVGLETFFIGAFKGFFKAAGRTAVGFYEMFTFPYPQGPILEEMEQWLY
ncbi:MAG: hypothetical protein JW893_09415 [Candidatus Omnitrophica bacterium]|nr:hypothetical protein [Candidatus Omnitrophota bacterium]